MHDVKGHDGEATTAAEVWTLLDFVHFACFGVNFTSVCVGCHVALQQLRRMGSLMKRPLQLRFGHWWILFTFAFLAVACVLE